MKFLTRILFAPECWACRKGAFAASGLCFSCWKSLLEQRQGDPTYLLKYSGAAPFLLAALRKEGGAWAIALIMKLLVRGAYIERWKNMASVVMAPTSGNRGLEILAKQIANELSIPFFQPLRKTEGHHQHGKDANSRLDCPLFVHWKEEISLPSPCLLIDDLKTTGTTLDQAAYQLRKRGVEVECFTLSYLMVMHSFESQSTHSQQESHEVDPFLLHLFM